MSDNSQSNPHVVFAYFVSAALVAIFFGLVFGAAMANYALVNAIGSIPVFAIGYLLNNQKKRKSLTTVQHVVLMTAYLFCGGLVYAVCKAAEQNLGSYATGYLMLFGFLLAYMIYFVGIRLFVDSNCATSQPGDITKSEHAATLDKPKSTAKKIMILGIAVVGILFAIVLATFGKLVGGFLGKSAGQAIVASKNNTQSETDKFLVVATAVAEAKKKLPITAGNGIIGTDVHAGDGLQIVYEYLIPMNVRLQSGFKTIREKEAVKFYCENMRALASEGISVQWVYSNNLQRVVINARPFDCPERK